MRFFKFNGAKIAQCLIFEVSALIIARLQGYGKD
jgi:hypothetical protein